MRNKQIQVKKKNLQVQNKPDIPPGCAGFRSPL